MTLENSQDAPLGVLLISSFWIFIGIWFLVITGENQSGYGASFTALLSIFFIILGWGLITLKKWSFYLSMIFAAIGSLYSIFVIPMFFMYLLSSYLTYPSNSSSMMFLILFFAFIPMLWYLNKKRYIFIKKIMMKSDRICPTCQRVIPFDANICPYCGRKFENFF